MSSRQWCAEAAKTVAIFFLKSRWAFVIGYTGKNDVK